jgi:hypothetical protein
MKPRLTPTLLFVFTLPLLFSFVHFKFTTLPAWYKYSGPHDVDYNYTNYKKGELYFYFDTKAFAIPKTDSWHGTYTDSAFTAYLVNATDTSVGVIHQDGSLIMIQEAQDPTGKWSPVEIWYHSDCGNSYFGSPAIGSNQYVKIPIPKYSGSFQTKLRLKLKIGKGILYSEPFNGSVDPEQFKKETNLGFKSYLDEKDGL